MIRLSGIFILFFTFFLYSGITVAMAAAPINDNFSSPTSLSGATGTVNASNVDATAETGEPNHGSGDPTAFSSIWFRWTASSSEEIFFNTFTSDFDTTLAAYTGPAVNDLDQRATNDDFGLDAQSQIHFTPATGTTYYIAVDGYADNTQGSVVLQWLTSPANDDFNNATLLAGSKGTVTGSNITATTEPGEPIHSEEPEGPFASVWYSWTATTSGRMVMNTFGSDFDTTMAAYTGTALTNLTQVTVNDDSGNSNQSMLNFQVIPGTTYHIAVDSFEEGVEIGDIILNYQYTPHFLPAIYHLLMGTD